MRRKALPINWKRLRKPPITPYVPSYGPDSPQQESSLFNQKPYVPKKERPPFRVPTILISIPVCGDLTRKPMSLNTEELDIKCCMVVPRELEELAIQHQRKHGGCDTIVLQGRLWKTATGRLRLEAKETW